MIRSDKLVRKLNDLAKKYGASKRRAVAYSVPYAIYVHEDLEAHHDVGQAKFLETAVRQNMDRARKLMEEQLAAGRTIAQATLIVMQMFLRESNKLVPVASGALRDSGAVVEG